MDSVDESIAEDDFNDVDKEQEESSFFSGISSKISPLENKTTTTLIQNFSINLQKELSDFIGTKATVDINSVVFSTSENSTLKKDNFVISSFAISPIEHVGLFRFNYPFMHYIFDALFGAGTNNNSELISSLGKSGHKIAEKTAEICTNAFSKSLQEISSIKLKPLNLSDKPKTTISKHLPDYFFELTFTAEINGSSTMFSLIVPEALFEEITAIEKNHHSSGQRNKIVDEEIKKDIISSSVTLIATLDDIKLKIKQIMELKSGDLIPISDPTVVFLTHNNKKIF